MLLNSSKSFNIHKLIGVVMKRIAVLLVMISVFIIGCGTDKCESFYDCLPSDVHPGDTGCGGCHSDENGDKTCYEQDKHRCTEHKIRYACIDEECSDFLK